MDFLLECIGFPPDYPLGELVERARREGEPAAWRGDPDRHRRIALGGGLEVRVDRDRGQRGWNVLPYYQVPQRLRVAVDEIRHLPDSPFDALLVGWAAPPVGEGGPARGAYRLSAFVTDARRLPLRLPPRHVLALSLACFALDVTYSGPDEPAARERASGGTLLATQDGPCIVPLGGPGDPGGAADLSLSVLEVRHLENPITREPVDVVLADAPERPLALFASRWQLARDGLPAPRPGWRIEGTFLFSGRIAGGLPGPSRTVRGPFG